MKNIIKTSFLICFSLFLVSCSNSKIINSNNNLSNNSNVSIDSNENIKTDSKADKDSSNVNITSPESSNNKDIHHNDSTNVENKNKNNKNSNITIVIDPGHSSKISNEKEAVSPGSNEKKLKDTLGSTGVNSKKPEYEITNAIALKLEEVLKSYGYNVILTKRDVNTKLSNIERANIANNHNANLMIRLHCDAVDSKSAHGASMLVPTEKGHISKNIADKSKVYGEKIINSYVNAVGFYNRGIVYRSDLTGFNWSKVPVVLLELGFISNPKEDAYLSNSSNYSTIANGIADGIKSCFN